MILDYKLILMPTEKSIVTNTRYLVRQLYHFDFVRMSIKYVYSLLGFIPRSKDVELRFIKVAPLLKRMVVAVKSSEVFPLNYRDQINKCRGSSIN